MLRAGFARIDITPGPDCSLMGYEFRQEHLPPGNDGVHDPLFARALVLDDGTQPAALLSLDIAVLPTQLARRLRESVAAGLNTQLERVILACIHTHSGPTPEAPFTDNLDEKILDAVARAEGLKHPVDVLVRQAPLGMGYNRRVNTGDGLKHCWSPQEFPDRMPGPATDPAFTLLEFRQVGGPRRHFVWNVGVHPVVLGKTSRVVSADYPGAACALIEEYVPGSNAMFLLGAAGDTHPWIATQEKAEHVEPVARAAASFAALLSEGMEPAADSGPVTLAAAGDSIELGRDGMDLVAWRLGKALIVTVPVELFGELAAGLRQRVDGPVVLSTVTNGWSMYLPTTRAFEQGGYEVDIATRFGFKPGDGEVLINRLVDLVGKLRSAR